MAGMRESGLRRHKFSGRKANDFLDENHLRGLCLLWHPYEGTLLIVKRNAEARNKQGKQVLVFAGGGASDWGVVGFNGAGNTEEGGPTGIRLRGDLVVIVNSRPRQHVFSPDRAQRLRAPGLTPRESVTVASA